MRVARRSWPTTRRIIDEITAGLDPYFGIKPKAGVVVVRVPPFAEKTAPGAYYNAPPLDGSKPGRFYANLRNVGETPKYGMRTLAYHEAVPGHHLQIAIAQELEGLPFFRSIVPVHRVPRRLGAVRRAARVGGGLREGSARQPGPPAGRDVPRRAPRGRHRPAQQALDARAGDRLHGREHRHAGKCGRRRDRALSRRPGSGAGVQGRDDQDPGAARAREGCAGQQVRHPRVPRRGPEERRDAVVGAGARHRCVCGPEEGVCRLREACPPAHWTAARNLPTDSVSPRAPGSMPARRSAASSHIAESALRIVLRR